MPTRHDAHPEEYEYYEIGLTDEIPVGERLFIEVDEQTIIIFNIDGEFFAIDDECTHDHNPLADGELSGHQITCPRHGAKFDVKTGKALTLPAVKGVNTYPLRVVDNKLEIGIKSNPDLR